MPEGTELIVVDSGVPRTLAASKYNERRAECEEASRKLGVKALRDVTDPAAVDALPEPLRRRARHVLSENERVEAAIGALSAGDMAALGALLERSHASLRDDYEVSTEAVEGAVDRLHAAGAVGARIVGGGFGGNVLGLLPDGATAPAEAIELASGPGAHLLS
jgi:galactokinase